VLLNPLPWGRVSEGQERVLKIPLSLERAEYQDEFMSL